eukprot:TRINITY_DN7697_c0_g1_i1.p1 TRINITY_DN7697_c0_g1~~TRINITY_DN7697_c0_g1_i1.p1  ORF type:complete len:191 (+),score=50.34 TRINITY_DN7697_c0_g1_i1:109-681(+)
MAESTKDQASQEETKVETQIAEAEPEASNLSDEEAAKAAKRKEIQAKVAAAQATRQKQANEDAAKEEKKRMIDEKGTAYFGDHAGITCDGCGTAPVFGYRFRCKSCPNHDICETCFDAWCGGKGVITNGFAKQTLSSKPLDHSFYLHKDSGFKSMVSGAGATVKSAPKIKPNETCSCGSGKKYKKCCMNV